MGRSRWGHWLRRQSADYLAFTVEALERIDRVSTVQELARILITTPAIVRKILRDHKREPTDQRIYYSPDQLSSILRARLNAMGDERAQTIPIGRKIPSRNLTRRRRTRPAYQERLDPTWLEVIERRAEELGQWLSCEEAAWMLGVTKQTLLRWRRARERPGGDVDRYPAFFASSPRTERLVDEEEPDRILESRRDWQRKQEEVVPSSQRDPVTGYALERASGRYPPVVYDRNLLVVWARRWAYTR